MDRGLSLDTTIDGAGIIRGDLTPECSAMVQAVLDAPSVPEAAGDYRTHREHYHDALAEAMALIATLVCQVSWPCAITST